MVRNSSKAARRHRRIPAASSFVALRIKTGEAWPCTLASRCGAKVGEFNRVTKFHFGFRTAGVTKVAVWRQPTNVAVRRHLSDWAVGAAIAIDEKTRPSTV